MAVDICCTVGLQAIGDTQQRERMLPCRPIHAHALLDVSSRNRAVRADVVWVTRGHLLEYRTTDLHRVLVILALDAPGAVVPGTTLDGIHGRPRHHLQHFARLLPDLLDPEMTGNMVGDLPEGLREIGPEQAIPVAEHEILERIEHGVRDRLPSRGLSK